MFCIATHDSNSNCTFELLLPNLQSSSFPVGGSSLTATAIKNGCFVYGCVRRQIAGNFNHHEDAALGCGAYHPIEHTPGFD